MSRAFSLVGCAALVLAACGGGAPSGDSVVLVTLDTTRYDGVGFGGAPAGITPVLDAVAAEGVSYTWARTVAPLTAPSHASILTGLYPPRHGVRANGIHALPEDAVTLAERARAAGYQTSAFIAAVVLDATYGLDQGFEHYDEVPRGRGTGGGTYAHRPAAEVVAAAVEWLGARDRERPFFLWLHLFDPHEPYDAEAAYYRQVEADFPAPYDKYYAEIAEMDDALARFFDVLRADDAWERTSVAVVADHGESLGAHGEGTHGPFVYDATVRVPLCLRFADGRRAGERSDETVSVVDLYPTLLELMDLAVEGDVDGRSLNRPIGAERGVYAESYYGYASYGWAPIAAWIDRDGKYVHGPSPQLFRPRDDEAELEDHYRAGAGELERYVAGIADVHARPALASATSGADAEALAGLAALGYAEASAHADFPSPLEETDRPAPRTRLDEMNRTTQALILQGQKKFAEAAALHRAILAENPHNTVTWQRLGMCRVRLGDWPGAIEAFRRYLDVHPGNATIRQNLGTCLLRAGKPDEAIDEWLLALELDPDHEETLASAAQLLLQRGRREEAQALDERLRALREGGAP